MATGKALVITASGGTDVFSLVSDFSVPAPSAGELIIKVVAASVNPVDVYVRRGGIPSPNFPKVIGGDASGYVYAVAEGSNFSIGDAVYVLSNSYLPFGQYEGTYAEYVLVREEWVAQAPDLGVLSLSKAAGIPLVFLTALQALEKAKPQSGQRILVLGASGAVGQFGVQLSKVLFGLHVTAVSSARHADFVRELGADEVWDYAGGAAGLEAAFSSSPFDIVFDVIGGDLLDASAKVLAKGGVITHIQNRGTNGADERYQAAYEAGTGPRFEATLVDPSGEGLRRATELFNQGKVTLKVSDFFRLEDAGQAHDLVIDGHAGGKVILSI